MRELAARGSRLSERLAGLVEPAESDPALVERRWAAWVRSCGRGDEARLRRRLAYDGVDEATVRAVLGPVRWKPGTPLPAWTALLEDAVAAYDRPAPEGLRDPDDPFPFDGVWTPWAEWLWERAAARPLLDRVSHAAALGLRRRMLAELCALAAPALHLEFELGRLGTAFDSAVRRARGEKRTDKYRRFIQALVAGGLQAFFREYTALGRRLCEYSSHWEKTTRDLLTRLEADRELLDLGSDEVSAFDVGDSDPHDGGRRVMVIAFRSGRRLVYKPRAVELCAAWDDFCAWLAAAGAPSVARRRVWPRGEYGWLEYVARTPCANEAEVDRFFRRLGHLLGLTHVVRMRDLHYGNLVEHADMPVPIDVEVLLQGRPVQIAEDEDQTALRRIADSVLTTGLLPMQAGEDDRDISVVGAALNVPPPRRRVWRALNTDDMAEVWDSVPPPKLETGVALDGRIVSPFDRRGHILAGFDEMAAFLAGVRERALASKPFQRLADHAVRLILRGTAVYTKLRHVASAPHYLREAVDPSIEFEALASTWASDDRCRPMWPIAKDELASVERDDVPMYFTRPRGRHLESTTGVRVPFEIVSGLEMCRRVWADLERDAPEQRSIIERSLLRAAPPQGAAPRFGLSWDAETVWDGAAAVARAVAIAEDIERRAVHTDGGVYWLEPAYSPNSGNLQMRVLGADIYAGRGGMAVFAAALYERTRDPRWARLALDALRPLRAAIADDARTTARSANAGWGTGLGGALEALTRCGRALHDDAIIADATTLTRAINPARADDEPHLDIIFGAAGILRPLLALGETDLAVRFGERLLRVPRPWAGVKFSLPVNGYSHGQAGIVAALAALWRVTKDARIPAACREALAYEDSLYDGAAGAWRRGDGADGPVLSWCYGGPGIAIGRIESLDMLPERRADRDRAVASTLAAPELPIDFLCCGNFGRVMAVRRAGLIDTARSAAAQLLANTEGPAFRLHGGIPPAAVTPTLFGGTAGIGLELLRLEGGLEDDWG